MEGKTENGKGDTYRKVDREVFAKNFINIFGEKPIKIWKPDDDPRKIKEIKDESNTIDRD